MNCYFNNLYNAFQTVYTNIVQFSLGICYCVKHLFYQIRTYNYVSQIALLQ